MLSISAVGPPFAIFVGYNAALLIAEPTLLPQWPRFLTEVLGYYYIPFAVAAIGLDRWAVARKGSDLTRMKYWRGTALGGYITAFCLTVSVVFGLAYEQFREGNFSETHYQVLAMLFFPMILTGSVFFGAFIGLIVVRIRIASRQRYMQRAAG